MLSLRLSTFQYIVLEDKATGLKIRLFYQHHNPSCQSSYGGKLGIDAPKNIVIYREKKQQEVNNATPLKEGG